MEILNGVIGVAHGMVLHQIIKPDYLSMLTIRKSHRHDVSDVSWNQTFPLRRLTFHGHREERGVESSKLEASRAPIDLFQPNKPARQRNDFVGREHHAISLLGRTC